MAKYRISGVPICDNGKLVGILTNRDLKFEEDYTKLCGEVMTKEGLITAPVNTTLPEAKKILRQHKIEKLPLVDENFALKGLITIKDIEKAVVLPPTLLETLRAGCCVPPLSVLQTMYLTGLPPL